MSKLSIYPLVTAAGLAIATSAFAQVPKGDRVRLEVDPVGRIEGKLVASDDRSITVASGESVLEIERASIERAQRYQGEHRNWGRGLLIGAGVGLTFGLLIEAVSEIESGEGAPAAILSCAILGGGAGTLIGGLFKSDEWKTLPVENLTVSTRIDREHEFRLVVSASF